LEQSLRNITEEPANTRYAYILHEDICASFPEQTIMALKIPKDIQMEFPPVEKVNITDCSATVKLTLIL